MSPTSTSGGYHFRCPTGGEHISRHVETRRGKKIFLQSKNFLLMRYKERMKGVKVMEGQQGFSTEQGGTILENLETTSNEINNLKNMCRNFRTLLDEGTYKLDAVLNIVNSIKTREEEIMVAGGDQTVLQQINEEQINNLLEMLKTPAFQKIARQVLTKLVMEQ
jgi:hypothetical protein